MMLVDVWVGDPGSCPSFVYNLMKMNGDDTGARGFFEGATHRLFATFGATFGHKLGINWALAHSETQQIIAD